MSSLEELTKSLAMVSLGQPGQGGVVLAKRPDAGGTKGKQIQLLANLYKITFKQSPSIAHYDVSISIVRDNDAPAPATQPSLNRDVTNAIWDALCASNPEGLGPKLNVAGFDSRKNCFSLGKLFANGSKTFQIELPAETENRPPRRFEVKLQLAQLLDLSVLEKFCQHKQSANLADSAATAIMAVDVLLRHSSFRRKELVVAAQGRKFLNSNYSTPLGEGAHMLAGLFHSVRPTTSGMVVNLDTAFSPYIITGQLRAVCNAIVGRAAPGAQQQPAGRGGRGGFRGGRGGGFGGTGGRPDAGPYSPHELHELKRKLVGAKVRVTHRKDTRPFIIKGFGQPAATHQISVHDKQKGGAKKSKPTAKEAAEAAAKGVKIPLGGGKKDQGPAQTLTVAEYFKKTYPTVKIDPRMQCVELRGGQMVPIECLELLQGCAIPPTKLSASQASAMINVAAKPPAERRAAIERIRKEQDFGPGSRPAAWGIEVAAEMMRLQGRVLPPPKVTYHPSSGRGTTPFVGFGSWNLKDSKFVQSGKPLEHWAVAVFADERSCPRPALEGFFRTLMSQFKQRGMAVVNGTPKIVYQTNEDALTTLKAAANLVLVNNPANRNQVPPQMIFCILKDPKRYDSIKKTAAFDLPIAVPTQVLLVNKVTNPRGIDQYCGNVALKINAKLGGINSILGPSDLPGFKLNKTLMLGADVTHPTGLGTPRAGAGVEVAPSIAAVVASTDGQGAKYAAQVREQEGRKEFITDLTEMTKIHIESWAKANKGLPEVILMFRDGVSEGQYAPVVQEEVTSIKAAIRAVDHKWNPKLTYIVCAKRHNIRLFAQNPADQDRTGNLPPGVVVDTALTHPYAFDFFVQAHAGLKGTAKPTRYICLLDENNFGSDALQKLINSLCYGFARATRSVSLVPVAYYADIVAGKARSYVTDDDASTTASGVARAQQRDRDFIQKQLDREFRNHKNAMGAQFWWI
ncbi:hypothetical protein JCM10213_007307 [Rhodosporidiobolus nylandii]